jgi:hypothetical protein
MRRNQSKQVMKTQIFVTGVGCLLSLVVPFAAHGDDKIKIPDIRRDDNGFRIHTVESPYQAGETEIRVLLPTRLEEGERYPAVYVLPVEPGRASQYGDGLLEVQKHKLHDKYRAIFIAPTFSNWPWYADHPTKPEIRQESHFLKVVVPFVEKAYPASEDRLLLGFSKSGWGAWSLLLRHQDAFRRAAAWDAPLMMEDIGKYGTSNILGTQENFERYRPADLLRANAGKFGDAKRLMLTGYGNFREHHQQIHTLLNDLKIPHDYRDGPPRKHDWHSGWVPEAVELLFAPEAIEVTP